MDALDVGSSKIKSAGFQKKFENLGYSKKKPKSDLNPNSRIRRMCKNQLYFDINVVYVIVKRSSLSAANGATRSKWDVCKNRLSTFKHLPKLSCLVKTFDFVRRLSTKTKHRKESSSSHRLSLKPTYQTKWIKIVLDLHFLNQQLLAQALTF